MAIAANMPEKISGSLAKLMAIWLTRKSWAAAGTEPAPTIMINAPSLIVHKGKAVHIEASSPRMTIQNILFGTARPEPNPPVTHAQLTPAPDQEKWATGSHPYHALNLRFRSHLSLLTDSVRGDRDLGAESPASRVPEDIQANLQRRNPVLFY